MEMTSFINMGMFIWQFGCPSVDNHVIGEENYLEH